MPRPCREFHDGELGFARLRAFDAERAAVRIVMVPGSARRATAPKVPGRCGNESSDGDPGGFRSIQQQVAIG